ncbi:MAG TPA: hypothetical protein VN645_08850 [Steroidobacteraceae bacterium]|nr:hypothetical protein [Steroidobacteraceae bacterium]
MNRNKLVRFSGAMVMLAAAPHVNAQQAPRCSDLYDDAQRLACYDAAFGKPGRPATAPAPVATPPANTSPSAARAVPMAPAAAVTAVAPAAAGSPATVQPAAPKPDLPKNVSAAVRELARRPDGRFVVTMDNGLVWSQLERDTTAEVAVGDTVTVRAGVLGSYILTTRGGVRTKVKAGR